MGVWLDLWLSEEGNERRGGVHAAAPDATQVTTTSARARAPSRLPRADFSSVSLAGAASSSSTPPATTTPPRNRCRCLKERSLLLAWQVVVSSLSPRLFFPSRLSPRWISLPVSRWCGDGGKRWGSDGDDMGLWFRSGWEVTTMTPARSSVVLRMGDKIGNFVHLLVTFLSSFAVAFAQQNSKHSVFPSVNFVYMSPCLWTFGPTNAGYVLHVQLQRSGERRSRHGHGHGHSAPLLWLLPGDFLWCQADPGEGIYMHRSTSDECHIRRAHRLAVSFSAILLINSVALFSWLTNGFLVRNIMSIKVFRIEKNNIIIEFSVSYLVTDKMVFTHWSILILCWFRHVRQGQKKGKLAAVWHLTVIRDCFR